MISCSLSPNTERDDVWLAFRLLLAPWVWKRGSATAKVEAWARQYYHVATAVSFNSGRAAELALFHAFGIGKGDEVIVQAFSCVAVANSVRFAGAAPVFADIDDTYNMDLDDFVKKITKRTKAVIVQHTFGIPAQIEKIISIAKKYNMIVIEDFAHTLSLPLKGDAAFLSFGRDKVLSSVFGGMALMKTDSPLLAYHKKLEYPSYFWIFQQLFHPVAFAIILPLYTVGIGKALLVFLQRIHLLSFPQIDDVKKYPNALATLLLLQLKKLERYSRERNKTVEFYGGTGTLLRFPMQVADPKKVIARAKKQGILLGNWYHNVIDPEPIGYVRGSCPNAEKAAAHVINLPTRIPQSDAGRVKALL